MIPNTLPDIIADLYARLGDIERRARNRKRTGTIEEVGTGDNAGRYRVKLSEQDGKPFLTGWLRTRQQGAGAVKIDVTLTKGEQVDVISESGDLTDAQIDLSTYSDQNQRANTDNLPYHIKIGDTLITASGDEVHISAGTIKLNGKVYVTGDVLHHNAKNVGDDHEHTEVLKGGDLTGPPAG